MLTNKEFSDMIDERFDENCSHDLSTCCVSSKFGCVKCCGSITTIEMKRCPIRGWDDLSYIINYKASLAKSKNAQKPSTNGACPWCNGLNIENHRCTGCGGRELGVEG